MSWSKTPTADKAATLSTWTEILAWFSWERRRLACSGSGQMAALPGDKLQEHNGIKIMSGYLATAPF